MSQNKTQTWKTKCGDGYWYHVNAKPNHDTAPNTEGEVHLTWDFTITRSPLDKPRKKDLKLFSDTISGQYDEPVMLQDILQEWQMRVTAVSLSLMADSTRH